MLTTDILVKNEFPKRLYVASRLYQYNYTYFYLLPPFYHNQDIITI